MGVISRNVKTKWNLMCPQGIAGNISFSGIFAFYNEKGVSNAFHHSPIKVVDSKHLINVST